MINDMLNEREPRYGPYIGQATIAQNLKFIVHDAIRSRKKTMSLDKLESLDMICHKIARIINGDPNYMDNWIDIAGYAMLIVNRENNATNL